MKKGWQQSGYGDPSHTYTPLSFSFTLTFKFLGDFFTKFNLSAPTHLEKSKNLKKPIFKKMAAAIFLVSGRVFYKSAKAAGFCHLVPL
jgi:hypothetical protein